MYALVGLFSVKDGVTQEATIECADLDAVFAELKRVVEGHYKWQAVTLIHIEDLPRMMTGAVAE